ncbi:MAG: SAM-dependent methyltransferase [Planctomycetes bacterium]|nr:SAM-dependent methyltransferase [Planctomycetota bacterium]
MPPLRTRLAVALVSLAVIGTELALMRSLSLRYWHHFAYLVISVALLGFGASGTALALLGRAMGGWRREWLAGAALLFALAVPAARWLARGVPLDVQYLSWNLGQAVYVGLLQMLMFVPFFFGGAVVGLALTDEPDRIGGHYAANLVGSGLGGVAAVLLMHVLPAEDLFIVMAAVALVAGAVAMPWYRPGGVAAVLLAAAGLVHLFALAPRDPLFSPYKMLPQALAMPGSRVIHHDEGPLGRLDVVEGPALHYAPGLSLQFSDSLPPHVLLMIDGDAAGAVYDCTERDEWSFLDYTTGASAYHVRPMEEGDDGPPAVLIVGAGGGGDIGLARYHGAGSITGLEQNPDIIAAMTGPLRDRGGRIYEAPGVEVRQAEARGYLASTGRRFRVIQVPPVEAFGASGAGLYATQESYLYTVEAMEAMLDHMADGGLVCLTRWADEPPRDGLRLFDTARAALERRGLEPAGRLAMIRNWATVTVLASAEPFSPADTARLRAFCGPRRFDLCYLPDLRPGEVNRYHVLDHPYFAEGAAALLGSGREAFLAEYPFDVRATTDDRPFFSHFFRWKSLPALADQLGRRLRAYLERGYLLLAAALVQSVLLAAVLILVPLAPRAGELRSAPRKAAGLAYFLLIGLGFMALEMGFLGRLMLYLADPVYAAAAVISSFLVFGGIGSLASRAWPLAPRQVASVAAAAVVAIGTAYLLRLDAWLAATQGEAMPVRFLVAAAFVAPLAVAMGHLFPSGLRQVGLAAPAVVPWAWAVNGVASVIATVAAPLAAMHVGFARVGLVALGCYAAAGVLAWWLPERRPPAAPDSRPA